MEFLSGEKFCKGKLRFETDEGKIVGVLREN
jgi:hypothetical protein